jgi:hypothetical protein
LPVADDTTANGMFWLSRIKSYVSTSAELDFTDQGPWWPAFFETVFTGAYAPDGVWINHPLVGVVDSGSGTATARVYDVKIKDIGATTSAGTLLTGVKAHTGILTHKAMYGMYKEIRAKMSAIMATMSQHASKINAQTTGATVSPSNIRDVTSGNAFELSDGDTVIVYYDHAGEPLINLDTDMIWVT